MFVCAGGNGDAAFHAGVVVAGLQAGEVDDPGLAELPDQFAAVAWRHADLAIVSVFHLRILEHGGVMRLELRGAAEHHFMFEFAAVADHEFDGVAGLDLQLVRRKTHVVVHVDLDDARDLAGDAGPADGVVAMRGCSVMVVHGWHGLCRGAERNGGEQGADKAGCGAWMLHEDAPWSMWVWTTYDCDGVVVGLEFAVRRSRSRRCSAAPFIGDRARWRAVPAGIAVVVARQVLAHLDHAEHTAHFQRTVGAGAAHHRQGVVGQRHFHLAHGTAFVAHHHVVGNQLRDFPGEVALIDADHGRHVVAHGVHGVVRLVAMQRPVAFFSGVEFDGAHLADGDVGADFGPARSRWRPATVGAGDDEFMAVQVDRMIGHGQVADADAHAVVLPHRQRIDAGEGATVPGPQVEVEHGVDLGRGGARIDVVSVEQEHEIAIDAHEIRILGMGDPEAHHAHRHLHHFIGMRVIHESAGAARSELVDESFTRRDARLGQPGDAVHTVGQALAVPVHRGVLGQLIGDENAHPVALDHFYRRPRTLAVVTPQIGFHAWCDFAHHRFGDQVEFLDAVVHAPGQI